MIARTLALLAGGLICLNLITGLFIDHFDANHWWFDFRLLPQWMSDLILAVAAISLIAWSIRPQMPNLRRGITCTAIALLCVTAICNAMNFYLLLAVDKISPHIPIPLSAMTAGAMGWILWSIYRNREIAISRKMWGSAVATAFIFILGVPLSQIVFFGNTDYRRPADAAIVFGARAYADGRPSNALSDRVHTACELYQKGFVRKLVFSGGPGDGAIHETEVMKRLAMDLGVPSDAIVLDAQGVNTAATVRNVTHMSRDSGASRLLAVSHFYHLPRIKLEFERAGMQVYTVPSPQGRPLNKLPLLVAREIAALWVYYLN